MGERILVPLDGSPLSMRALERAVSKHPDAEITVLYVIDPMLAMYEAESRGLPAARSWHERMTERAEEVFADARELVADYDSEIATATEVGKPARTILEYADEHDVEHVVMGSHGREGVSRLVFGSVAESVVRQAPIPVTIVR